MPRVNIYIRNDDWDSWESISDKPGWVHDALTTGMVVPARSIKKAAYGNLVELETKSNGTVEVTKETPYVREDQPVKDNAVAKSALYKAVGEMMDEEVGMPEPKKIIKTTADLDVQPQKVKGDRCPHGFNLKVSKCKYGCKK